MIFHILTGPYGLLNKTTAMCKHLLKLGNCFGSVVDDYVKNASQLFLVHSVMAEGQSI